MAVPEFDIVTFSFDERRVPRTGTTVLRNPLQKAEHLRPTGMLRRTVIEALPS
jgi:hypothetical protein